MIPDIRWIEAVYGIPEVEADNRMHIAVPETARTALLGMADDLVGTNQLIAHYVPEGTEDVYRPGAKRGRLVCLVKLVPMPSDKKVEDYFYDDWDKTRRWPIGRPAELICAPPVAECPLLREHVETLFGSGSLGGYVKRFQKGPFKLEHDMCERLNLDFSRFAPFATS